MAEREQAGMAADSSAPSVPGSAGLLAQAGGTSTSGSADILARLAEVFESRRGGDPSRSYVAKLLAGGDDRILKKVGEEATEVVIAAMQGEKARIVSETADLWFHTLVMLAHHELRPQDVLAELMRREGLSGIDEKASRRLKASVFRQGHDARWDRASCRVVCPVGLHSRLSCAQSPALARMPVAAVTLGVVACRVRPPLECGGCAVM